LYNYFIELSYKVIMHLSFTPLKQVKCVHLGALLQVAGFSSLSNTFGAASDWADLAQTPR
jgi:hypothetical protein